MEALPNELRVALVGLAILLLSALGNYGAVWLRSRGKTAEAAGREAAAKASSQEILNNFILPLYERANAAEQRHITALEKIADLEERRLKDEQKRAEERLRDEQKRDEERTEVLTKNSEALTSVADSTTRMERAISAQTQAFSVLIESENRGRSTAVTEIKSTVDSDLRLIENVLFAIEQGLNRLLVKEGLDPIPDLKAILEPPLDEQDSQPLTPVEPPGP